MHRFWPHIIEPLLEIIGPRRVLEIGAGDGRMTHLLLDFARRNDGVLHSIDPNPGFDVEAWQVKAGGNFVFHRDRSLNAIPQVGPVEVVLIDGDHNWYTVFHELSLLAQTAEASGAEFPVVLMHDIDWPYGRRDMYYDPATVPEEYRGAHEKKGILPGQVGLADFGGLNPHLGNAQAEGGARNGVLTAAEDFLRGFGGDLVLTRLAGFHGLGILIARGITVRNRALQETLLLLKSRYEEDPHILALEASRVEAAIRAIELAAQIERRVGAESARAETSETEAKWLRMEFDRLKAVVEATHARLASEESRAAELDARLAEVTDRITMARSELEKAHDDLHVKEQEAAKAVAGHTLARATVRALKGEIAAMYRSKSWRYTAPFRSLMAWTRGMYSTLGGATLQFAKAAFHKALLPSKARDAARSLLMRSPIALLRRRHHEERPGPASGRIGSIADVMAGTRQETRGRPTDVFSLADEAMRAGKWSEAESLWQKGLDLSAPDTRRASLARMNISVARRVTAIHRYKWRITEYAESRARRRDEDDRPRIAVYTVILGGYDSLKLPEVMDPRLDYIVFADVPIPNTGVFHVRPVTYFCHDMMRVARFVKTHPHFYLPKYDVVIWIDASVMILGDIYPFVESFLASGKLVAAIPHPFRSTIHEEVEECIRAGLDDPAVMRAQVALYRQDGLGDTRLAETGFSMFDLRDSRTTAFLDLWWSEIERHSRRDQISFNYATSRCGLDWHALMQKPANLRSHPAFALVPHSLDDSAGDALLEALGTPFVDPYSGPSYAEVRAGRISALADLQIDIVVCVRDALDEVKRCLESVRSTVREKGRRLIIVNDGSAEETTRYLEEFVAGVAWGELHHNRAPVGYTRAANQGMKASTGQLVVLLNSDTIVTADWLEKMADAVHTTPRAGIVGVMSNAASHQSIPEHRGGKEQTAINELPPGMTPEDMNRLCEAWTTIGCIPLVTLVHGFCIGITRQVIDRIGYFDDRHFPRGYGEENDYCFRAADAGFALVIATHTFVYHAKSRSYRDADRAQLMKSGRQTLVVLYGRARVDRSVRSMEENLILERFRRRAQALFQSSPPIEGEDVRRLTEFGVRMDSAPVSGIRQAANTPSAETRSAIVAGIPGRLAAPVLGDRPARERIDFLDFGTSHGGSIEFALGKLGGKRGVGIDNSLGKVRSARSRGYECLIADARWLAVKPRSVRFVTMMHLLEHLPDVVSVEAAVQSASSVASEFVVITLPYFDADEYLASKGLKFYWSDWTGHPTHLASSRLKEVLGKTHPLEFRVFGRRLVTSSKDPAIHSVESPRDQFEFDANIHPPKPEVVFDRNLFYETVGIAILSKGVRMDRLLSAFPKMSPL